MISFCRFLIENQNQLQTQICPTKQKLILNQIVTFLFNISAYIFCTYSSPLYCLSRTFYILVPDVVSSWTWNVQSVLIFLLTKQQRLIARKYIVHTLNYTASLRIIIIHDFSQTVLRIVYVLVYYDIEVSLYCKI